MIDPNLSTQVIQAAERAAARSVSLDMDRWVARLRQAAAPGILDSKLPEALAAGWAGACPLHEAADAAFDLPPLGNTVSAIGMDGSQIYPDGRSPVQWAYVQVVAYETGCPPVFGARFVDIGSALAERNPEILDGRGDVVGLVNAWRSIMEFQMAARVARSQAVVLLDGGLLPWPSALKSPRHADDYRRAMTSCRLRERMIAGVISNPQSRLLARMIHLHEAGSAADAMRRHSGPSDTVLMRRLLQPGQRSALFAHANGQGKVFEEEGVQIWFFFLRINQQEVVRVEIPHWVGRDTHKLAATHATLLADSQATGYSYVLSQAHRLVVVPADVAAPLQQTGVARYWSFIGRAPAPGAKRRMKMASSRRCHGHADKN